MNELRDCPFDAGDAVIDGKSESARARCLKCGALGPPFFFDSEDYEAGEKAESDAANAWNNRSVKA